MVMHRSKSALVQIKAVLGQDSRQAPAASPGFTLVELIMIIVLISIISVSIMPKFISTSSFSLVGGAAMVAADIRYAQELAMGTHQAKTITFSTNDTYYTVDSRTVNLPPKVTISSGATFIFNSLGEPTTGGGSSVEIQAGSSTKTITVESYTGRVSSS
jgi:type II secretory pathway pseudopilin PulG